MSTVLTERDWAALSWRATPDAMMADLSDGQLIPPPHLRLLGYLFYLSRRNILPRLTISLPPGHAKTTLVRWGCAWALEDKPHTRIAYTSYGTDLAEESGKLVRQILTEHIDRLSVRLKTDSRAADHWQTTSEGGMWSAGIKAGLTGRRISLGVVDDPHKDWAEATSEYFTSLIWSWYQSVFLTRLVPRSPIMVIQCILEGMKVLMGDGTWKQIESVCPGEQVWTYDEAGGIVRRNVTAQRCSGEDDLLTIRTHQGEITVNGDHPLLVLRDEYQPKSAGHPWYDHETLMMLNKAAKNAPAKWSSEWVKARDLKLGDTVLQVKGLPRRKKTSDGGGGRKSIKSMGKWRLADQDFLWLWGYMIGDGWVTMLPKRKDRSASWSVCIALDEDETLNERVASILERWWGRRPYRTKGRYFRLDCNEAGRTLIALGITGGAHGKRIPDWVFKLRPCDKEAVLRGYADADGAKMSRGINAWRVASVSTELIEDTRRLAMTCGVRSTNVFTEAITSWPPNSHGPMTTDCHSTLLTFSTPRKYDGKTLARGFPHWRQFRPGRIKSISPGGRGRVYDLTVDGGNFICEGFVVHNTRWSSHDLIARISEQSNNPRMPDALRWCHVRLAAIAEQDETVETVLGERTCHRLRQLGIPLPEWHREQGEPLWPIALDPDTGQYGPHYDLEWMQAKQIDVGPVVWQGMYQQRPPHEGGRMFKDYNWRYIEAAPMEGLQMIRWWDTAATEKKVSGKKKSDPDWTVGVLMGRASNGLVYVLDVERFRCEPGELEKRMRSTAIKDLQNYGSIRQGVSEDPAAAGKITAAYMKREVFHGFAIETEVESTDKVNRAVPFSSQQSGNNVFLVTGPGSLTRRENAAPDDYTFMAAKTEWVDEYVKEHTNFPDGAHDDQIDASSMAFAKLAGVGHVRARIIV